VRGAIRGAISVVLLFGSLLLAGTASPEPALHVEWVDGRLHVVARAVPRARVLGEVARLTGLEARGAEALQDPVSVDVQGLPLREALPRLLAGVSGYVLIEDDADPPFPPRMLLVVPSPGGGAVAAPAAREAVTPPLRALGHAVTQGDAEAVDAEARRLLAGRERALAVRFLSELARDGEPTTRLQALHLLHEAGEGEDGATVSPLATALGDQDDAVKAYAIQALAEEGSPAAATHLRRALRDRDPGVRLKAIEALAQMVDGRSFLHEAIDDPDAAVRAFASFWLEQESVEELAPH
jgi:hypothetical protein